MSGVIVDGVQWERCNQCAGWEDIRLLAYAPLNPALPMPAWASDPVTYPDGYNGMNVDMCRKCMAGVKWTGKYRDPLLNVEK